MKSRIRPPRAGRFNFLYLLILLDIYVIVYIMFRPQTIEMSLSGSCVNFIKRERPALSEEEIDTKRENERKLQTGIDILRRLRTRIFEEEDASEQQKLLVEAHHFSSIVANEILEEALADTPFPMNASFLHMLKQTNAGLASYEPGSGHALPPQFSIQNLFNAADDMVARIEKKAGPIKSLDRKLSQEEIKYVLKEFLVGANSLSPGAQKQLFEKDTKVGGILSGGSIYVELTKLIVERFGDNSFEINSFVIAVDKEDKKIAVETSDSDLEVKDVLVMDDIIDGGQTMLVALWNVGEHLPGAMIHSGKGPDQRGGFENRRVQVHDNHLACLFQDFADLALEDRDEEALAMFSHAAQYAAENNVALQPGWYRIWERLNK